MNKTYELMEKYYFLKRSEKEFLYDNINNILSIIKSSNNEELGRLRKQDKKDKKYKNKDFKDKYIPKTKEIVGEEPQTSYVVDDDKVPRNYDHLKTRSSDPYQRQPLSNNMSLLKEGRKIHDPETKEDIIKLLEKMEKFISLDNDISYQNISIFLNALCLGARRISLKEFKIVGLCKRLSQVSRFYEKSYKENKKKHLKRQFDTILNVIKEKLKNPKHKPNKNVYFKIVNAEVLEKNNFLKNGISLMLEQGFSPEDIKKRIVQNNIVFNYDITEKELNSIIKEILIK